MFQYLHVRYNVDIKVDKKFENKYNYRTLLCKSKNRFKTQNIIMHIRYSCELLICTRNVEVSNHSYIVCAFCLTSSGCASVNVMPGIKLV